MYIYVCIYSFAVAILAQGRDLAATLCRGLGVSACQHSMTVLTQVCAASSLALQWHCFFMECLPAFVW